MATIVYVSLNGKANSTRLRLRDSNGEDEVNDLTTVVNINENVKWVVDTIPPQGARRIKSIDNVYIKRKPDNVKLLTDEPIRQSDGSWIGTVISTSPGRGRKYWYNIKFTRVGYTTPNRCDPKLQMN